MIRELQLDIEECAKRGEFSALWSEISKINKDSGTYISKDEVMSRLNTLHVELKSLVEERPT